MKFDVTLVRALIEVPTVKYGMIEGTKIGYARLIQFTPDTATRLQDALDSFEKNGYKGLIIDLRDNPGGLITSAVDVADKFIDNAQKGAGYAAGANMVNGGNSSGGVGISASQIDQLISAVKEQTSTLKSSQNEASKNKAQDKG